MRNFLDFEDSEIFERHKNPLNLLLGLAFFTLFCLGLWEHNLLMLYIGFVGSLFGWMAFPSPRKPIKIISQFVDRGYTWWKDEIGFEKASIVFLTGLSAAGFTVGLWFNDMHLTFMSFMFLIITKLMTINSTYR